MKIYYRSIIQLSALLFAMMLFLPGCDEDFPERRFDEDEENMQIYDYVKVHEELSIYKEICDYSGFYSQISTAGSYTVFVPTNEAFDALFKRLGITSYKEKTPEYWMYYMKYHALEIKINTNSFESGVMKEPTMMGEDYHLTVDVTSYIAIKLNNKATIKVYNVQLQNGLVNVVDQVMDPPISTIYDLLKENGGYTKMLKLFEENGFKGYLTDSLATVLIEPDIILEEAQINPDTIANLKDWLAYHIYPGTRSFVSTMDAQLMQSLYTKDVTTFNMVEGLFSPRMYCNMKFGFSSRAEYGVDNIALNGIYHAMDDPLWIIDHTAGIIRHNLYGRTNEKKGYTKNVFADSTSTAVVKENTGYRSFHQGEYPPVCYFMPGQMGDIFELTVPDVVAGNYTIRLIYYSSVSCNLTLFYNNTTVTSNIQMGTADGNFPEWTTLQYKDCGQIEIERRGDVKLRFMATSVGSLAMDMIELRPNL